MKTKSKIERKNNMWRCRVYKIEKMESTLSTRKRPPRLKGTTNQRATIYIDNENSRLA
jgi:hypothetical protein